MESVKFVLALCISLHLVVVLLATDARRVRIGYCCRQGIGYAHALENESIQISHRAVWVHPGRV